MEKPVEGAAGRARVSKPNRRTLLKVTGPGAAALGLLAIADVPLARAQDMSNGQVFAESEK